MVPRMTDVVQVRRARDRFRTQTTWLDSWHSFSYGPHYDPANTHFGFLVVNNTDVVAPGSGFGMHRHSDIEIVTWPISGMLMHEDSAGHRSEIHPGLVQAMSTGTGIMHSERNDSTEPVQYIQMWLVPSAYESPPSYGRAAVEADLVAGELVPIASGAMDAPITIRQEGATLYVARLRFGERALLPVAPYVHVYVPQGTVALEEAGDLSAGDAARVAGSEGRRVVATETAEVLVWAMTGSLAR
jgi:quercetin 2,3-dioxygenase